MAHSREFGRGNAEGTLQKAKSGLYSTNALEADRNLEGLDGRPYQLCRNNDAPTIARGRIDEIAVYDRGLTPSELVKLSHACGHHYKISLGHSHAFRAALCRK